MKKTLLSLGLAVASFGVFAQTNEATAGNEMNDDATGIEWNFRATETENCPDWIPDSRGTNSEYTIDAIGDEVGTDGGISIVTSGSQAGWNKFHIAVTEDNCTGEGTIAGGPTLDLSNNAQLTITGKVTLGTGNTAMGEMLVYVYSVDGTTFTYNDNDPIIATNVVNGEFSYTVSQIDFGVYDAGNTPTSFVDSTKVSGIAFSFRNAWDDGGGIATVDIYQVKLGAAVVSGLEDNASSTGFEVYPNPAQDVVNFNYTVNGNVTIELANSLGSVVSSTEGTSMNVAELPAGVYFATLKVNGVATAVQRVQVQ
jgi:hypothetical protein